MITQEDKDLLLKEISARLPYEVFVYTPLFDNEIHKVTGIRREIIEFQCCRKKFDDIYEFFNPIYTEYEDVWRCKPCLRPMSSMTEEERKEYNEYLFHGASIGLMSNTETAYELIDWLNAHHFDYRGLIDKGLALEAPEGIYNIAN